MCNTQSELYGKLWILGDNDVSIQVHRLEQRTTVVLDVSGEA
jgi:hypothetical protein